MDIATAATGATTKEVDHDNRNEGTDEGNEGTERERRFDCSIAEGNEGTDEAADEAADGHPALTASHATGVGTGVPCNGATRPGRFPASEDPPVDHSPDARPT